MPGKMWDEIIYYPFPNSNSAIVKDEAITRINAYLLSNLPWE